VHELVFNMCDSNMHGERIKINCKHKKSLYSLSKTTSSPTIKAYYTQYSTILWKVIRKAKHLYYNKLIKTSENKNKNYRK
jgi:hypothetical protein